MSKSPEQTFKRSICPISNTLDIIGDKWTLIVIRDLLLGKSKYSELAESPEGIPSNLLADRLKRLTDSGLIIKSPYQDNPTRYAYTLTDRGRDLAPILNGMIVWGNKHIPGTWKPPAGFTWKEAIQHKKA